MTCKHMRALKGYNYFSTADDLNTSSKRVYRHFR